MGRTVLDLNEKRLTKIAGQINQYRRHSVEQIGHIGGLLVEAKSLLPHGKWLDWIRDNFGWNDATARRFMRVHELGKVVTLTDLEDIPVSHIYLLPKEVIETALTENEVRQAVTSVKGNRSGRSAPGRGKGAGGAAGGNTASAAGTPSNPTKPESEVMPNDTLGESSPQRSAPGPKLLDDTSPGGATRGDRIVIDDPGFNPAEVLAKMAKLEGELRLAKARIDELEDALLEREATVAKQVSDIRALHASSALKVLPAPSPDPALVRRIAELEAASKVGASDYVQRKETQIAKLEAKIKGLEDDVADGLRVLEASRVPSILSISIGFENLDESAQTAVIEAIAKGDPDERDWTDSRNMRFAPILYAGIRDLGRRRLISDRLVALNGKLPNSPATPSKTSDNARDLSRNEVHGIPKSYGRDDIKRLNGNGSNGHETRSGARDHFPK